MALGHLIGLPFLVSTILIRVFVLAAEADAVVARAVLAALHAAAGARTAAALASGCAFCSALCGGVTGGSHRAGRGGGAGVAGGCWGGEPAVGRWGLGRADAFLLPPPLVWRACVLLQWCKQVLQLWRQQESLLLKLLVLALVLSPQPIHHSSMLHVEPIISVIVRQQQRRLELLLGLASSSCRRAQQGPQT